MTTLGGSKGFAVGALLTYLQVFIQQPLETWPVVLGPLSLDQLRLEFLASLAGDGLDPTPVLCSSAMSLLCRQVGVSSRVRVVDELSGVIFEPEIIGYLLAATFPVIPPLSEH